MNNNRAIMPEMISSVDLVWLVFLGTDEFKILV